jgi:hypothetical protein
MAKITISPFLRRLIFTGAIMMYGLIACAPVPPGEAEVSSPATVTSTTSMDIPTQPPTLDEGTGVPGLSVTPRGPDLVATDPSTVNLASSGLQLVEFFRFT